ncbi:MAG: WYL domain-containing protein, partial [Selenomonadaceae bacterium]
LCKRALRGETAVGEIRFAAADLKWVAEFVVSILDKVRVISPPELKAEIKQRLNKINKFYKDDI